MPRQVRPEIDAQIDALLARRYSATEHQLWWDGEHTMLSGLTAREAVAAGEREAVLLAAEIAATSQSGHDDP
jgi:hypothetical protein